MQEKMTITLAGDAISKDLRDIAFASNKISKILNRIGYAIAAKETLDRQTFKIETTQIKEGSLIFFRYCHLYRFALPRYAPILPQRDLYQNDRIC